VTYSHFPALKCRARMHRPYGTKTHSSSPEGAFSPSPEFQLRVEDDGETELNLTPMGFGGRPFFQEGPSPESAFAWAVQEFS
jgi:hypothetical protein